MLLQTQKQGRLSLWKFQNNQINHSKILLRIKKILIFLNNAYVFNTILQQSETSPSLQSITLLSHRWNSPSPKTKDQSLETELGVITLLGWIGYTVLDHAIDGQHDVLKSIPLAERCMRELHWHLALLCKSPAERTVAADLLSLIETAHHAECRGLVPPPWHKSAGHMIGPLILTLRQGHTPKSPAFTAAKTYFIEFLTIKQLSDDLRDWQEDWNAGRHTVVTEHLRKLVANKNKTKKTLRDAFTHNTLKHFCGILIRRGNIALRALEKTGPHRDPEHFKEVINRLQSGAQNALNIIKEMKKPLK